MARLRSMLTAGLLAGLGACSQGGGASDVELADAMAAADEATAQDFTGALLPACGLLATEEVEVLLGELSGPAVRLAEDVEDTSDARCSWRAADGRELVIGGASEGGVERLAAIEPYTAAEIPGDWEQARLEGCCILHAVKEQVLVTLDFSRARLHLEQAATLMNAALARVHDPIEP